MRRSRSPIPLADTASSNRPDLAKKSLGQHFLVDRRVLARIVRAAEVSPGDVVVEIGPGRGILTRELARLAARVVAVELDAALAAGLAKELAGHAQVSVVAADARDVEVGSLMPEGLPEGTPYKVVANLPYYAASHIIRRFLESDRRPRLMVVMVQREVAQSMAAAPGKMGLLSVAIQLYGRPRIVSYVPPRAFRPSPKVTSAILRIEVYPSPALALDSEESFFRLVRAGFSAPRKQIHNCLRHALPVSPEDAEAMLLQAGIDPKRRAETLSMGEWGDLYRAFRLSRPTPC